ncbi:IS5 family transposase [Noviherbaspirillum sp. CPCC 100848]|jgi:transposase|uniref:IS5 family transposase n=1 Tax=Noviherbaspirillum album TaxID=3080276 RepID=A0ABU6J9N4_9BURK|nr:IS5 family transposase [Noviherbaspirillum sp. CPCC 100848]MEC4720365.1 IS5 family transposase [Noviherbaspirillum sp. CPCC 100848]
MWTERQRAKQIRQERKVKRYPSDLSDQEWQAIEPLLPSPARTGRRRITDLREVLNAIRYLVRSGCEWRMLPVHFPPWQTVYWWFRRFVRRLLFKVIHDVALMLDRQNQNRQESPSAAVIDSQTIKAPGGVARGYDANKKIRGRKRHVAVDSDGRLLMVNLTPADMADSTGAEWLLLALKKRWPWVKHLFADAAYDRRRLLDEAMMLGFVVEVVRKLEDQHTFVPPPRRWVVERSFGWMVQWRRLVRDYEGRIDVSCEMIYVAMGSLLLKRLFENE